MLVNSCLGRECGSNLQNRAVNSAENKIIKRETTLTNKAQSNSMNNKQHQKKKSAMRKDKVNRLIALSKSNPSAHQGRPVASPAKQKAVKNENAEQNQNNDGSLNVSTLAKNKRNKKGSSGNNNSGPGPIVINNNFNPPVPVPPAPKVPDPEHGDVFDLPMSIFIEYNRSNQHIAFNIASKAVAFAWMYRQAFREFHHWSIWSIQQYSVDNLVFDIVKRFVWSLIFGYVVSDKPGKLIFPLIKTELKRIPGQIEPVQRHEQNRSVKSLVTDIRDFVYKHKYEANTTIHKFVKGAIQYMWDIPSKIFGHASNLFMSYATWVPGPTINAVPAVPSVIRFTQFGGLLVAAALAHLSTQTDPDSYRPSWWALPSQVERFYDVNGEPKHELVSDELLQSAVNVRTVNGHVDLDRLDTTITNHITNRLDAQLSPNDYTNTASVVTSTTTVVKYIARENHYKATSMGFQCGPSNTPTNTAIGSSSYPPAGGQHHHLESNQTSGLKYQRWSWTGLQNVDQYKGTWVLYGMVFVFLTLTLRIHWGRLLARSSGRPLTYLFTRLVSNPLMESLSSTINKLTSVATSFMPPFNHPPLH